MSRITAPLVVTADELKRTKSIVPLDASWFMPGSPRNALEEYRTKRHPGARFLDLDEVASPHELGLKHMMPDSATFAKACGA